MDYGVMSANYESQGYGQHPNLATGKKGPSSRDLWSTVFSLIPDFHVQT